MSYRILPDNDLRNTQSLCNNTACPKPTIYWNPQVVHSSTGRMTPLEEPFNPHIKAPRLHRCMRDNPPPNYINKYDIEYKGASPKLFPAWVLRHYQEIIENGRCTIQNCRVHHH